MWDIEVKCGIIDEKSPFRPVQLAQRFKIVSHCGIISGTTYAGGAEWLTTKVKVQVEIEECADITTDGPGKEDWVRLSGSFQRSKHTALTSVNNMSWSKPGSVALAAVTALVRNREYKRWFQTGTLSLSFSSVG